MNTHYEQLRYEVESEYSGLADEETRSGQVCPACHGGQSKEGSLNITRRGGVLLYNCHRATCTFRGAIGVHGEAGERTDSIRSREHIPVTPIDQATAKFLASKFYLSGETVQRAGLGWTGEGTSNYSRRICFPLYGPDLTERGAQYRSYEGKQPKCITRYTRDDAIALGWYKWIRRSKLLVLVEDPMSPIKVAPHYHCATLLGTSLSEAKIDEIKDQTEEKYERVYLCLDNDATYEAVKQQLKWSKRLKNLMVLGLPKDIKNMNPEEFQEFLERLS